MKNLRKIFLVFCFFIHSSLLFGEAKLIESKLIKLLPDLDAIKQKPNFIECDRSVQIAKVTDQKGKDLEVSLISLDYAQEIFRYLRDQKDIPFRFPEDGCDARAHKMAQLMDEMGITSGKAFIEGELRVETRNSPKGYVEWAFHVAPFVMVKNKYGKPIPYILDPSTFDRAVPVEEWYAIQVKHKKEADSQKKSYFTIRYLYTARDIEGVDLSDYRLTDINLMNYKLETYGRIQEERDFLNLKDK